MNPKSPFLPSLRVALAASALAACSRSAATTTDPTGSAQPAVQASAQAVQPVTAATVPVPRRGRIEAATTTRQLLTAFSPDCLACAEKNGCLDPAQKGGAICEGAPGQAKSGASEVELCLKALKCIFNTKCGNTGEESQCLCGSTDIEECMSGKAAPNGSCVDVFKEDFGDEGKKMYDNFINPKYGAGRANMLIQCAVPQCNACRVQ
jgi:hypothetical protein